MYNKEDDGSVLCKNCGLRQLIPLTIVNSDGSCPCMQCGHKLFHKPLPVADGEGEKVHENPVELILSIENICDRTKFSSNPQDYIDALSEIKPLLPSAVTGGMVYSEDQVRHLCSLAMAQGKLNGQPSHKTKIHFKEWWERIQSGQPPQGKE